MSPRIMIGNANETQDAAESHVHEAKQRSSTLEADLSAAVPGGTLCCGMHHTLHDMMRTLLTSPLVIHLDKHTIH